MPKTKTLLILILLMCFTGFSCSDDTNDPADGDNDTLDGDTDSVIDGDTSDGDTDNTIDGDTTDGDIIDGELEGFQIRVPGKEVLTCKDEMIGNFTLDDIDYLCTIDNSLMLAEVYIQATPIGCGNFGDYDYTSNNAWIKQDNLIYKLNADYDFGGKHHNDFLTFTVSNIKYELWHSSIGFGWRACHTPDCMVVCDAQTDCNHADITGVANNGCNRLAGSGSPPLQVICARIPEDGSRPELLDPWDAHEGHDEYPKLPCAGEQDYDL